MSYPNIIYGRFGDEKRSESVQNEGISLGTKMILPDGREFVYAKAASSAALSRGVPVVQKAVAGTSVNVAVASNAAAGDTTLVVTMPATTLTTVDNQYRDGSLIINDAGAVTAQEGYYYSIASCNSAAAAATVTLTLNPYDELQAAASAGVAQVTIRENPFYDVLDRAAGTATVGMPAGVPTIAVTAGYYCWLQRKGSAALLAGGTLCVTADRFAACTVEASFQLWNPIPGDTTIAPVAEDWGYCEVAAAASTEYMIGYLTLP